MKRAISKVAITGLVASLLVVVSSGQTDPSILPNTPAEEGCSVASLKGAYGFFRTGTEPAGPLAAVGITAFDGHGGSKTRQTIRVDGVTTDDLFTDGVFDATYTVNRNCAAKFINPDGSVFGHAVVVDGGKEVFIVSLSDANTIMGVMKRIR